MVDAFQVAQESVCSALRLIREDPILYQPEEYRRARGLSRTRTAVRFNAIRSEIERCYPGAVSFSRYLGERTEELLAGYTSGCACGADPYFSSALSAWYEGLARGLEWVRLGARPEVLDYFTNRKGLESDLQAEYGTCSQVSPPIDDDNACRIVPVEVLLSSPRLSQRVQECLPNFPDNTIYVSPLGVASEQVQSHLARAINLIKKVDQSAAKIFNENVHTIFVAIVRGTKTSLGSRFDLPGTLIAGFSQRRLAEDDTASTAAQLYHEHCHIKLSLYTSAYEAALPTDQVFVSPFKNDVRDMMTLLHTAYTISIECLFRLELLSHRTGSEQHMTSSHVLRTLAYLSAVGSRLKLTTEIVASNLGEDSADAFRRVPSLASRTLELLNARLQELPAAILRAHASEEREVLERHAWDIGQFLCRGVSVRDPHLSAVDDRAGLHFQFQGSAYSASLETPRESYGDYGSYIEQFL